MMCRSGAPFTFIEHPLAKTAIDTSCLSGRVVPVTVRYRQRGGVMRVWLVPPLRGREGRCSYVRDRRPWGSEALASPRGGDQGPSVRGLQGRSATDRHYASKLARVGDVIDATR